MFCLDFIFKSSITTTKLAGDITFLLDSDGKAYLTKEKFKAISAEDFAEELFNQAKISAIRTEKLIKNPSEEDKDTKAQLQGRNLMVDVTSYPF